MKKSLWLFFCLSLCIIGRVHAQIASFNFSSGANSLPSWTNVAGDPSKAIRTATAGGVTISSVGTANWSADGNGSAAFDGIGNFNYPNYFTPYVMADAWGQYNGQNYNLALYNSAVPQLQLSGLNKDSTYHLKMSASSSYMVGSTQFTVAGLTTAGSQTLNYNYNTSQGVAFKYVKPDVNGIIRVYVNATSTSSYAYIAGIELYSSSDSIGSPAVTISSPTNGSRLSEGGNVTIKASAIEAGVTISKMVFYADSSKIGEVDTAPYIFTWVNPDPGTYTIKAIATDNIGTIGSASVNIAIESLNYFWSTTGNDSINADSNFVGTVDSIRLAFRTKAIERMSISPIGNVGIGTIAPTAQLHTTGTVRFAGIKADTTNSMRVLVSDTSGNVAYKALSSVSQTAGDGLGTTAEGISLGDSIPGPGPHSFQSNRYQYLNGYMYSIGGSASDPVTSPVFRAYNNGDISIGTTMDTAVNTVGKKGLRYLSKYGILQIGASDKLKWNIPQGWQSAGIIVNCDDANTLAGPIYASYLAGDGIVQDSTAALDWVVASGEELRFHATVDHSIVIGSGHTFTGSLSEGAIFGEGNNITKPGCSLLTVNGYENTTTDTARGSLVVGAFNQFGGLHQTVSGNYLVNRSPYGVTLGNSNVDFSSLPYTGLQGAAISSLASYPIFVLGNGNNANGTVRSNAMTVLYNGRTQINTTGLTSTLTQAQATPKAALDVVSTNTGVLLPRLTTTQRNAIVSGDLQNGLLLYNSDSLSFQYYNGSAWKSVGSGSAAGSWMTSATGIVYDSATSVGIGTSDTRGYKLAVNGNALFTAIKVKTYSAWPDYVFDKHYNLPELPELERYIREHHHLPGILSAKEMQGQDMDVAEQQTALLKKVEELTLYLIDENKSLMEQNKKLNEVNQKVETQQKEIDELKALIYTMKKDNK